MLMVDELYEEFQKHAKDMFNCTDLGYGVFYGTSELNKLSYQQRCTYEEAVGDKWKNQKYMRSTKVMEEIAIRERAGIFGYKELL
jgi:hypothetical protein